MVLVDDEKGQILLSGAFLFALAIAITAIMLNNMIYTNNVAYTGFSEQLIYDDSSLKHMMIDEIFYEYYTSGDNQAWFTSNMTAFMNAINNMTLTKGVYVKNVSLGFTNKPSSSQSDVVSQRIYIYGKNFNKSYTLGINYAVPVVAKVEFRVDPGNVIIKLGVDNLTSMDRIFIVDVINCTTYLPEPGVMLDLYVNGVKRDTISEFTDENGRKYFSLLGFPSGNYNIYVTVHNSPQRSNDLTVAI
jgi:hypothetical protein